MLQLEAIVVTGVAGASRLTDWSRYWILIWIFLTIELIWGSKDANVRRGLDRRAMKTSLGIVLAVVTTPMVIDAVRFSYLPERLDLYFWAVDAARWWVLVVAGVWGAQRASGIARSVLNAPLTAVAGVALVTYLSGVVMVASDQYVLEMSSGKP